MTPFASPTGEPRPDMLLLLGVLVIALSALRPQTHAAARWVRALAHAFARVVIVTTPREKWSSRWTPGKARRHNPASHE